MPNFDFTRMFSPRGIAIIGASSDPTKPSGQTVQVLQQHGYQGGIYPVNPKYPEVGGRQCFASVADITEPCDVAVITLPAAHVPEALAQCGRRGIRFAVVFGGGFREAGPQGIALEAQMLGAARAHGMRLIGPNCLGFVNIHQRVFASFGSITRPPDLLPGPVSAVIQSGGFGNSLVIQAARAGIGFRYLVASGNETDIKAPEMIKAFVDDPDTRIILAYLEGISDGRAFMSAARYALAAAKPLVVLKAGNTRQGLRAAASHTACMTGSYDIYRAAFRQCGVVEVHNFEDTVDTLRCLLTGRRAQGRNVAVMTGSGGSAVNFSDAADDFGLVLAPLAEETRNILKENLPSIASIHNPIDYTAGFVKESNIPRYLNALQTVLADPAIDQVALFFATASGESFRKVAQSVGAILKSTQKSVMAFSAMPPEMTIGALAELNAANIPVLGSPQRLAAAMRMVADYSAALDRRDQLIAGHVVAERPLPALPAGAVTLDEHATKQFLSATGVAVTRDALLPVEAATATLPAGMQFPVAVKIVSKDIAHKTDIGAVRLNVGDNAALAGAITAVVANARKAAPSATLTGVLVSEMVSDAIETIIGVVNDPLFGPVVAFGLGGVLAETLHDITYRIAPFDLATAREMVGELRASAIFSGVRGQAPRDVEALARSLAAVSECAWLLRDRIVEMDINPVLVRAQGQGAVAADALLVLR